MKVCKTKENKIEPRIKLNHFLLLQAFFLGDFSLFFFEG